MKKEVRDHLGVTYFSAVEMCLYYGVDLNLYYVRLRNGWTLEDALTKDVADICKECADHLNNVYPSITAMAVHYGIHEYTLRYRLRNGWSLESALTETIRISPGKACVDHLGNSFDSSAALCRFWHISYHTFLERLDRGWSIQDAITTPVNDVCMEVEDHLGNTYSKLQDMLAEYKIDSPRYFQRKLAGWSLEKILTTPVREAFKQCTDHLGNVFESESDMAKFYSIPRDCFYQRFYVMGWSLEKTLTTPPKERQPVMDMFGNIFTEFKKFTEYWGVSKAAYCGRKKRGKSIQEMFSSEPYKLPTTAFNNLSSILDTCDLRASHVNFGTELLSEKEFIYWDIPLSLVFLTTECSMYLYSKDTDELLVVFSKAKDSAEVFLHKPVKDVIHICFIDRDV